MPPTPDTDRSCLYSRPETVEELSVLAPCGKEKLLKMIAIYVCDHPRRQADLADFRKEGLPGVPCPAGTYGCSLHEPGPHGSP